MMHRVVHSCLVLAVLTGADRFLLVEGQSAVRVPSKRLDVFLVPQLVLTLHHSLAVLGLARCSPRGILGGGTRIAADARPVDLTDDASAATCFGHVLVRVSSLLLYVFWPFELV